MKRQMPWLLLVASFLLGGCAHVLSDEARLSIDPLLDYARVKQNPQAHLGKTVLLGGLLVETRVLREGTDLEVVLFTLDRWGRPLQADFSRGRFIARTETFLDPELFRPGLHVTLTGQVAGEEIRPLRGVDYPYPVFTIGEIHLWQTPSRIYAYPPYYSPYPWGPYYDPFWGMRDPYWHSRPDWRYR